MTRNNKIEAYAWRNNWELTAKSGATIVDIYEMFQTEARKNFRGKTSVLICVGSNDLHQMAFKTVHEKRKAKAYLVESMKKMVAECHKQDIHCIVMAVVPRRTIQEKNRREVNETVAERLADYNNVTIIDLQGQISRETFMRECLYKELHFHDNYFPNVMKEIAERLNITVYEEKSTPPIAVSEFLKFGECDRCGRNHSIGVNGCNAYVTCEICGGRDHSTITCVEQFYMCRTCGERGHRARTCVGWVA